MIEQLLDRTFVLDVIERAIVPDVRDASATGKTPDEFAHLSPDDFAKAAEELEATLAQERSAPTGQRGFDAPPRTRRGGGGATPDLADRSYFSRDSVVSNAQSALELYVHEREPHRLRPLAQTDTGRRAAIDAPERIGDFTLAIPTPAGHGGRTGRRIGRAFEIPSDPRWVSCLIAQEIAKRTGKHPFPKHAAPPAKLSNDARIVMFGDWGTGLKHARAVARHAADALARAPDPESRHAIHLGDVYYSGWPYEYEKRVKPHWPVQPEDAGAIGSWALNGNHDMYSGGYGYFDHLLTDPLFARQGGSSYFSLESDDWLLLGLDTAWEDHRLACHQPQWVAEQVAATSKQVVLLSHHQLFSVYDEEKEAPELAAQLAEPLASGKIRAWIWGHEHRCMIYGPHAGVGSAYCFGHGGVPVYQWHAENAPLPPPAVYEYRGYREALRGFERWALCGFAILDLKGREITIRYMNEAGVEHRSPTTLT